MDACRGDLATPYTYDVFSGVFGTPFDFLAPLRQHLPGASTSEISEGPGTATTSATAEDDHERALATESTPSFQDKLVDNDDLIKATNLITSNILSSNNELSKTDELLSRMIHLQGEILGLQSHLLEARKSARITENTPSIHKEDHVSNNNDWNNTDELLSGLIHLQGRMLDIQSKLLGVWQLDCHDLRKAMTGNPFMGACDENDFELHHADQHFRCLHSSTLDPRPFLPASPRFCQQNEDNDTLAM